MTGLFITGTDTGVGKTVVTAAIAAALIEWYALPATRVAALKPIISGVDEPANSDWPHDDELLAQLTGRALHEVSLYRFGPAVSPHLAAELAREQISIDLILRFVHSTGDDADVVLVEGAGGLLVPLSTELPTTIRDLAISLNFPIVIVARPELGTINHTLLTIESARAAGLRVAGVVLTPWPAAPESIERSNRATIERLGDVQVATLPRVEACTSEHLARAGSLLPLSDWLPLENSRRDRRSSETLSQGRARCL